MSGVECERQALRAELERAGVPSESIDALLASVRALGPGGAHSEKLYVPGAGAEPPKPAPVSIAVPISGAAPSASVSSSLPATAAPSADSSIHRVLIIYLLRPIISAISNFFVL